MCTGVDIIFGLDYVAMAGLATGYYPKAPEWRHTNLRKYLEFLRKIFIVEK
jgi:hypothetical protein